MFFWAGAGEFRAGRGEWPLAGVAVADVDRPGGSDRRSEAGALVF